MAGEKLEVSFSSSFHHLLFFIFFHHFLSFFEQGLIWKDQPLLPIWESTPLCDAGPVFPSFSVIVNRNMPFSVHLNKKRRKKPADPDGPPADTVPVRAKAPPHLTTNLPSRLWMPPVMSKLVRVPSPDAVLCCLRQGHGGMADMICDYSLDVNEDGKVCTDD